MVERRICNFCGDAIEPGTGKMFVKRDGTVYSLCSNKCKKNLIDLKRVPRRTRWTKRYAELKEASLKHERAVAEKEAEDKKKAAPKKKAPAKKKPAAKKAEPETKGE
ncbi:MAG: 50S ribosomal protein L24e [Thermoplasmata archaeon]|nr:50S ribosomal protein L24e [Thermoplasmata archaeon]